MDYEKLHKDTITKLQEMVNSGKITAEIARGICADFVPESENEDERIRKALRERIIRYDPNNEILIKEDGISQKQYLAWLKKQGEQKSAWSAFEAEHGKYYYCIKDYFCGGKKQASKGDVVQALRGLPIMGLKDASEYFLPVNYIKCNFTWSEEDESLRLRTIGALETCKIGSPTKCVDEQINWLKSLKDRYTWKPSDEQMNALKHVSNDCCIAFADTEILATLYEQLKALHRYEQDT